MATSFGSIDVAGVCYWFETVSLSPWIETLPRSLPSFETTMSPAVFAVAAVAFLFELPFEAIPRWILSAFRELPV